jgi:hypothetical protein
MNDKVEEILFEAPFLQDNEQWGGRVAIVKVTVTPPGGPAQSFINKRLTFGNNRYINLPRKGIEEVIEAVREASKAEREQFGTLIQELNSRRPPRGGHSNRRSEESSGGNNRHRK